MPLLAEYAITPDVFDTTSYASEEICRLHLDRLREVMLAEGLVRDLRDGEWRQLFATNDREWHRRGKELIRKLATQGRLIHFRPASDERPIDDSGWCAEALATHNLYPLTGGVIVTNRVKAVFEDEELVASVDRLPTAAWWTRRSPSVRLPRTLDAYKEHLELVLHCANSISFIDPYLNPRRGGYQGFGRLLAMAGGRRPAPRIEVHRVCWEEACDKRFRPEFRERIERNFREALEPIARESGLKIEVFLWDDFHDRYVISNLIGISVPYGFDTTTNPSAITTWTRLSRDDRDDVQREFDESSGRHVLKDRFQIP